MDKGLVPPCLELGDGPEHRLLAWAGRHTGRQGLVMLSPDRLEYRLGQEVPGVGVKTFTHLEDGGWIEKVRTGESYRYRVLTCCSCGSGGFPQSYDPALRREYMLPHNEPRLAVGESSRLAVGASPGGMEGSAQKPVTTVSLSKYFFPEVVRAAGIQMTPLQTNGPALAHHLNQWKLQGIDLSTMQLMMEEFARHPEWCRRSRKPPWRVFIARRDELASIVAFRKRKDPARRRWSGGRDYFLSPPTPRVVSVI